MRYGDLGHLHTGKAIINSDFEHLQLVSYKDKESVILCLLSNRIDLGPGMKLSLSMHIGIPMQISL